METEMHTVKFGRRQLSFEVNAGDHLGEKLSGGRFYENDVLELLLSLHIPGTVVLDVGANIGNHTAFFAAVMGAKVIAVEANPDTAALLTLNVERNQLGDLVTVMSMALGREPGSGRIIETKASNRGMDRFERGEGDVELTTIDAIAYNKPISLIKIDVEGMELDVVAGGNLTLDRWKPHLAVAAKREQEFRRLAKALAGRGYAMHWRTIKASPTYIFTHVDQIGRMSSLLDA